MREKRERERKRVPEERESRVAEAIDDDGVSVLFPFLLLTHRLFLLRNNIKTSTKKNAKRSEASPPDLDALATDLPDDHPFAVRAEVSPEEAELAAARLRVRRGLPLRDLSGARGFSSAADEETR